MLIHIENLTPLQVEILDQIWACKSVEDYDEWYLQLTLEQQILAKLMKQLVLIELLEQRLSTQVVNYEDTRNYLKKFML